MLTKEDERGPFEARATIRKSLSPSSEKSTSYRAKTGVKGYPFKFFKIVCFHLCITLLVLFDSENMHPSDFPLMI